MMDLKIDASMSQLKSKLSEKIRVVLLAIFVLPLPVDDIYSSRSIFLHTLDI